MFITGESLKDGLKRKVGIPYLAVKDLIHLLQGSNFARFESGSSQADDIHIVIPGAITPDGTERGDIVIDRRAAANKGSATDTVELVDSRESPDSDIIFYQDMTGHGSAVGKDVVVPYQAVVRNMAVCHEEVLTADYGLLIPLHGSAVYGAELAKDIVIADYKLGQLTLVF